jgi:hypothetical protein
MGKNSDQPSGVVGGTMDVSVQGEQDVAQPTDAAAELSRRRMALHRADKLEALRESAKKPPVSRTKH